VPVGGTGIGSRQLVVPVAVRRNWPPELKLVPFQ
jgi:hypothetical protein